MQAMFSPNGARCWLRGAWSPKSGWDRLPIEDDRAIDDPGFGSLESRCGSICSLSCLWFSLLLSIWLSGGWMGLLLYGQVLAGSACLEKLTGKRKPATVLAVG
jgi:hypothetical protein